MIRISDHKVRPNGGLLRAKRVSRRSKVHRAQMSENLKSGKRKKKMNLKKPMMTQSMKSRKAQQINDS